MMPFRLPSRALLRQVSTLALPVIFTNVLQSLVNVVDVFMAGRLGPIEIAAVGMGNTVRLFVFIGILAVTSGSMALAAQARGARDNAELSFVARQSLSLTVLLALVLSTVGYFAAEPLLSFLNSGGDPRAVVLGTDYLQLIFIGTVFLVGTFSLSSLMQGAGDTVTPMVVAIGMNVLNIFFNWLFMFGPGPLPAWGVAGAALGTLSARFIGISVLIYLLYSGRNVVTILPGSYKPDWAMFRDLLAIGVPSGLQGMVRNSAQLFVTRIVTSTAAGTYGASALAIGLQIESLAFMPGIAVSVAATSLVGQSLGRWQVDDARERGNAALFFGALVMSAVAVPLFVFAPQLVTLFDPSAHPTVVTAGTSYLRINALAQPILAFAMVLNGALRGAGDTRPGLIGTLLGRWGVVLPLAYLFALPLGLGVTGVWWALVAGTSVQALYISLRWFRGRWTGVALRKSRLYRLHLKQLPDAIRTRFLDDVRAPLLALEDTSEIIEAERVRYRLSEYELAVTFDEDGFDTERYDTPQRWYPPTSSAPSSAPSSPQPARRLS